jgi:DNA-binding NarL/FixJ family response regulator
VNKRAQGPGARTRILIVDDHPMMREGLAQLIGNEKDLEVCGQAETGQQAFELVKRLEPGLVLLDISLPDKSGLDLIKDFQSFFPTLAVLVISMHDEALYAERVLRAGGRGYIMKQEGGKKLMQAIRQVLSGQIFVSEKISLRILENFSGRTQPRSAVQSLTDREFEVFQLIGQGLATREIAERLHLSVKTVEVHRVNMKQKLQIETASQLIRYAVQWTESEGK